MATKSKGGNPFGLLGSLAGIAVAIAVPFVSPAIAGAIFGPSVMAALGGWGGILATAGTGAVLGGIGAAVTGNDWRTGALLGGLGGGVAQGFGGLAGGAGLFGAGTASALAPGAASTTAGLTAAAPSAIAPITGVATAGGALGSGLAAGAAPAAVGGLGAFQMPWDKLFNAGLGAAPTLLGSALGEYLPPSEEAQAQDEAMQKAQEADDKTYKLALREYNSIDPDYFAQTAANSARLRSAMMTKEGMNTAYNAGLADPSRVAAEARRNSVAASTTSGQAYNDAYLTALEAKRGQASVVAGLRPSGNIAKYLTEYGSAAERKKRAEELAGLFAPFSSAFLKTNTAAQAGTV